MLPIQNHPIWISNSAIQVYVPVAMTQDLALLLVLGLYQLTCDCTDSSTCGTAVQKQTQKKTVTLISS